MGKRKTLHFGEMTSLVVLRTSIIFFTAICIWLNSAATLYAQCADEYVQYVVSKEKSLKAIASEFGSELFSNVIRNANAETIDDPESVKPGTVLQIPAGVANYNQSGAFLSDVLSDPNCNQMKTQTEIFKNQQKIGEQDTTTTSGQDDTLDEFREAFESLVEAEPDTIDEEKLQKAEERMLIEMDGMIHDETRSKIGRDFYEVFYAAWQPPPDARNFSITISEQPFPSLGTIVTVEVIDTQTFRTRLQPRFAVIEEAANYAVRLTYNYLKEGQYQIQIY